MYLIILGMVNQNHPHAMPRPHNPPLIGISQSVKEDFVVPDIGHLNLAQLDLVCGLVDAEKNEPLGLLRPLMINVAMKALCLGAEATC